MSWSQAQPPQSYLLHSSLAVCDPCCKSVFAMFWWWQDHAPAVVPLRCTVEPDFTGVLLDHTVPGATQLRGRLRAHAHQHDMMQDKSHRLITEVHSTGCTLRHTVAQGHAK